MGKQPIRNSAVKKQVLKDTKKAHTQRTLKLENPREVMKGYTYIPCDYESAKPANLKEENLTSYQEYTQTIAKNFAIEYAKDLNEQVDNARGNGKLEGKANKTKRDNYEKKYLYKKYRIKNPGHHCEETANKVLRDTLKTVQGSDIYENRPEDNLCPTANVENYAMCKQHPEIGGGYVNIQSYIAEIQKHDPYCVIDTVVPSNGNISGSGLHRVTIAPTVDKNSNVVMDEKTGLPKMTVYSFNRASKTPLESYVKSAWGQSHGFCINMNDYARHNLKEEYQKDSEKTQEDINRYLAEHNQDNLNKSKITVAQIARNSSSNSM